MSEKERRDAANRLMDVITDLDDDLVLEAEDTSTEDKATEYYSQEDKSPGEKNTTDQGKYATDPDKYETGQNKRVTGQAIHETNNRKRWMVTGLAGLLLAGLITLGIILGQAGNRTRPGKEENLTTESGIQATTASAELDSTEAGIQQATEAGITEAGVTEAGITEAGTGTPTEAATQQTTEAVTEAATQQTTEAVTEAASQQTTEATATETTTEVRPSKYAVHVVMDAKTEEIASLEDMEKKADVILKAIRLDTENPVLDKINGEVVSCYMLTRVEIVGISRDTTGKLKPGQLITILENEAYDAESDTVYHVAGYDKMVAGAEYLLFLKRNVMEDGSEYYVSCGVNYGTVSLTEDGRYSGTWLPEHSDMSHEKEIWEAARKKYMN